jgi:hypothetical protein
VAVLEAGALVQHGRFEDLRGLPASSFFEQFRRAAGDGRSPPR